MELPEIATAAAALLLVLAGIMAITWVLRRFFGGAARPGHPTLRRRDRRLGVVEAAQIGNRHRLLLVRRDDREHLLLIGGATELVIETGIPHPDSEAEVNIRSVEPRFDADAADRRGAGYRPADERDAGRDTFARPSFGSAFSSLTRDATSRLDTRSDLGRSTHDDRDIGSHSGSESPFAHRSSAYDDDEKEPPRFGRDDQDVAFEDRDPPFGSDNPSIGRLEAGTDDRDYDDDPDNRYERRGTADTAEDDPSDRSHSRILSRFLKKDGS